MTCQKCLAFYREVLTILVYGQVSMLSDSISELNRVMGFIDIIQKVHQLKLGPRPHHENVIDVSLPDVRFYLRPG